MRQLLLSVLLLSATWAVAQSDQTSPSQTSPSQTAPPSAGSDTSIQGCVSGSDGNFMLTDKNGTSFKLTGETAKLTEHVGHEVEITGSTSSSASTGETSSDTMGRSSGQQTLQVTSVKHVSKTCKSGGTAR